MAREALPLPFALAGTARPDHIDHQGNEAKSTDGEQHQQASLNARHGEIPCVW
ncbi:hypothetical protein D3C76_1809240 [compost metagenome]